MTDPPAPWSVPDEPGPDEPGPDEPGPDDQRCGPAVRSGFDSDADGVPDSVFAPDGEDLLLHTDLGDDGLADQTLRLRPDGTATREETPCVDDDPSLVELLLRFLRGR